MKDRRLVLATNIKNARRFPSAEMLAKLAQALKVAAFELLMSEDSVQQYQEFMDHQHLFEVWAERLIETVNNRLHDNQAPVISGAWEHTLRAFGVAENRGGCGGGA